MALSDYTDWVGDAWDWTKGAASDVGDWIGGKGGHGATYKPSNPYAKPPDSAWNYGEAGGGAANLAAEARARGDVYGLDFAQGFADQAFYDRGPQAVENYELAQREANADAEQQGSLQLAREAAMGNAPSEAAYMMQQGLDQGIAEQQSQVAGARGAGALALAQGNAGGNTAAMNQRAFTEAGRLRANEMAQARGLYGSLAQGYRGAAQNRLGMGNSLAQGNAQMNDAYKMGMGDLGVKYGALGSQYFGQEADIYRGQQASDLAREQAYLNAHLGADAGRLQQDRFNTERSDGLLKDAITFGGSTIYGASK